MDISYLREKLSIAVAKSMLSPVYRMSYSIVYINGINYGLYLLIEDVDDFFIKSRLGFDPKDLPFYKCNGDLVIRNNKTIFNNYTYEPKNKASENATLFVEFVKTLHYDTKNLNNIFDVSFFLRTYIMEVVTGNWDGIRDANNYYLVYNPNTNQFCYFRHDLDASFNEDTMQDLGNFSTLNIFKWTMKGTLPALILKVAEFRALYVQYFTELLVTYFKPSAELMTYAFQLNSMVAQLAYIDNFHSLDNYWPYKEVVANVNTTIARNFNDPPTQFAYGIEEFVKVRYTSAMNQLKNDF